MGRTLAGIAAFLLLVTGGVLMWQSKAEQASFPPAPRPRLAAADTTPVRLSRIPNAPSADPKSKEEKRFDRADKDEDGQITLAELVEPRRTAFAKLDLDRNGTLSFEEWAVKTIDKFNGADTDKSAALSRVEYASTAPKPRAAAPKCGCG